MTPTFFFFAIIGIWILAPRRTVITQQIVWCLFGGSAAMTVQSLGGATITPAVMFLPFLVHRAIVEQRIGGCLKQCALPSAGFWLLLFILYGLFSAVLLPRAFAGTVDIMNFDRLSGDNAQVTLYPLRPGSGNITQSGYAVGGLFVFVSVSALLRTQERVELFRDSVLLLASLNCIAALLNVAEIYLHLPSFLAMVRNANYAIMVGGDIHGLKRISGTFAETSAFSAFSLPLLVFSFILWIQRVRPIYTGTLTLFLLSFLIFSTSTTAYLGLFSYATIYSLLHIRRTFLVGRAQRSRELFLAITLASLGLGILIVADATFRSSLLNFVSTTILNKLDSSSGVERSSWNSQAWSNFLSTYGIGVGLGSARASSFLLVLLSNVGVPGVLLFATFLLGVYRMNINRLSAIEMPVVRASRHAVFSALLSASISGTVFDLGIAFYAYAAGAAIRRLPRRTFVSLFSGNRARASE